jgi:thiol-disulfide isomerase/thioredoxin
MKPHVLVIGLIAAVAAAAGGYWFHQHQRAAGSASAAIDLPADTVLQDLDGKPHHFADWHGKLLLLNFWATWCSPCLDEIPELIKAQQKYSDRGLQIVGPAVDDADAVRKMQSKMGMSYPVLVGTPEQLLQLMTQLGNTAGGLPFSVLADGNGHVLATQLGQFNTGELAPFIEQHLH